MKKWLGIVLTAGIIMQPISVPAAKAAENGSSSIQATTPVPSIVGESGAVIDVNSGKFLYTKNADAKEFPASITKILTIILVEEHLKLNDVITISKEAASQSPSNQQILYHEGEKLTVNDALNSLMIISSNDIAYALAERVGGTEQGFAQMMNEKAKELGATDTHFVSPNGLPNPDHYTSAHDMALFGREATKYQDIIARMGRREAAIKTNERTVTIKSPNIIPKENPKAIGGKTGYTDTAQHTLIEILQDGTKKVVAVTMHSTKEGAYSDINVMSNYAFSRIQTKKLYSKGAIFHTFELNGEEYPLSFKNDVILSTMVGQQGKIEQELKWNNKKKSFKKGETVGWLVFLNNEIEIGKYELITDKSLNPNLLAKSKENVSYNGDLQIGPGFPSNEGISYAWTIGLIFLTPIFTFIFLKYLSNQKKKKRLLRQ